MLSMTREMTSEERELIQSHINDMFERFKNIVKEGRPYFAKHPGDLDKLATGEIFTSDKAIENKLIDKIGFQEDAIDRAIELASLDKEKTKVVRFKKPVTLADSISLTKAPSSSLNLASLLEFSAPRAWFLCSSLPAIAGSHRAD
jgi:protease-4